MSRMPGNLPKLEKLHDINRRLSVPEYYHACIGAHSHTLDPPREIAFVIDGEIGGAQIAWQAALDKVVAENPGARLRLTGRCRNARWLSDGVGPRLRIVEQCDWDGRSEVGAEFIDATPLSLENGPTAELIIASTGKSTKVIFRVLHAVMDGIGVMHFFQELFRALRGEALLGTNAAFSDVDLMLNRRLRARLPLNLKASACLTGDARSHETGHIWRRVSLRREQNNLLSRIALAVAEFARTHSGNIDPVCIAIPVSLRRHVPGLLTTMNFSSMIHIDINPDDTPESFRKRLHEMLNRNVDTDYHKLLDLLRCLPFAWLDRLMTSTIDNYASPKLLETAVLSNLGSFKRSDLSCPGFDAQCLYGVPFESNCFSMAFGLEGRVEIVFGMTRVLADDGRLDAFVEFLEQYLDSDR
ncbi:MAG TPA: hypothetical protein PLI90_12535 [Rhodocyclaceae bacterium]|nr:hypothetical protein [Rhodocyclaceae bacterium]